MVCSPSPLRHPTALPPSPCPRHTRRCLPIFSGRVNQAGNEGTFCGERGDKSSCPAVAGGAASGERRLPARSWHEADMTPPLPDDVRAPACVYNMLSQLLVSCCTLDRHRRYSINSSRACYCSVFFSPVWSSGITTCRAECVCIPFLPADSEAIRYVQWVGVEIQTCLLRRTCNP